MKAGGGDRPTLDTVARAAGVSRSLASFALNDRPGVSADSKEKILRIAADLGYRPDPLARELRTGRSSTIGFIVRNIANPFFNDVLAGMQQAAFEHDVTVVAMDSEYSEDRERQHIRTLVDRRVGALAIAPVGSAAALQDWRVGRPRGQTVLVNSSVLTDDAAPRVAPSAVDAVDGALDHLLGLGHRRIAFLTAPDGLRSDEDRLQAHRDWCVREGVEPILLTAQLQGDDIRARTRALLDQQNAPTAVVTNSDHAAHFVYLAARDQGVVVGQQLSVVGHDDLPTSALLDPPLSTVAVDRREIGRETYRRLSGEATGDWTAPVTLTIRSSSAPPH